MPGVNLTTSMFISGTVTTGVIEFAGFTSPVVTQLGEQTPDIIVAEDGSFTLSAPLGSNNTNVNVHVEDADGRWIEGPVTIIGDGAEVPVDPPAVLTYADIGMNLVSITGYNGNYPFANVLANMYPWSRRATSGGSGSWSQNKGSLTASVATDQFTAVILNPNIDGVGWVDGTYRVFNPDGCQIAFGYGADSPGTYKSDLWFDVNLSPSGTQGVYMFVKGSLTGKVKVVQPGYYDGTGETSTFTSVITGFYNNLTRGPLRFMDWTMASQNYEVEWADRVTPDHISFSNAFTRRSPCVPWEYCIDLANLLNRDAWLCISPRASADYVTQLATLVASRLNPGLKVWIEVGNEIWNPSSPWLDGYKWVTYLNHTLRVATPVGGGSGNFTLANHGFAEEDRIVCFSDAQALNLGLDFSGDYWRLNAGADAYVRYIDADTFSLANDTVAAGGVAVPVYSNLPRLLFKVPNEAGKTVDRAKHYAELALRNWDIFDSIVGVDRVKRLVCGQAGDSGVLSGILTQIDAQDPVGRSRTSYTASAPYFNGHSYGCKITLTSGTFTPSVWCSVTGGYFLFRVYAAGSTPTDAEIIAGTGAINAQTSSAYVLQSYWQATGLAAVTGLSNGTTYKVYVVGYEYSTTPWIFSADVVAAASGTALIWDSYAQQAFRMVRSAANTAPNSNSAVSGSIDHISYELGADYNYTKRPDEFIAWRDAYMESQECADALVQCMYQRAAGGVKMLSYFSDCGSGPFSLASNYGDTTDKRLLAMKTTTGRVEVKDLLNLPDIYADDLEAEPSYPFSVATLPSGLTFTIVRGNDAGNFAISGTALTLANGTGIDWTAPQARTLTIFAHDGYIGDTFTVTLMTGVNWYTGYAGFAWSGLTDSDPAAINPAKGGTLALTGTPAVVSGGMWAMGGAANYTSSSTGNTAGNAPWLVAAVIDRNSDVSGFKAPVQVGNSSKIITFYTGGGGAANFTARFLQGSNTDVKFAASAPTGKHVYWAFWDGTKVRAGYDLIENTAAAVTKDMSAGITQYVKIGDNTNMKIGAVQSVCRVGMTFDDAMALVTKMKTHASIP